MCIFPTGEVVKIERKPVKADTVVAVGYDMSARVLEVEFRDAKLGVYQFCEVSVELYEFLMKDGNFNEEYFIQNIRESYLCSRVL